MQKKVIRLIAIILAMVLFSACGNEKSSVNAVLEKQMEESKQENVDNSPVDSGNDFELPQASNNSLLAPMAGQAIDIDLTQLSSTMVYSEVYNIMMSPEDYYGKKIKMSGSFAVYEDEDRGTIYFSCIISDATACCAQGIEFLLDGDYTYPDDYPELNDEITVIGIFEAYAEDGYLYARIRNARLE